MMKRENPCAPKTLNQAAWWAIRCSARKCKAWHNWQKVWFQSNWCTWAEVWPQKQRNLPAKNAYFKCCLLCLRQVSSSVGCEWRGSCDLKRRVHVSSYLASFFLANLKWCLITTQRRSCAYLQFVFLSSWPLQSLATLQGGWIGWGEGPRRGSSGLPSDQRTGDHSLGFAMSLHRDFINDT